jgi:hypothetical protein
MRSRHRDGYFGKGGAFVKTGNLNIAHVLGLDHAKALPTVS